MEPTQQKPLVRFGMYEISLNSGELRKAGMRIKVQQQPIKVLEILLEHPGELVTREELRTRVWPNDSFGDFDQAVNIAIGKLRSALGDSADNPRFIETLPKRGYRFIAEVRLLNSDAPAKITGSPVSDLRLHHTVKLPRSAKTRLRPAYWIAIGSIALLSAILAFWFNRTHHSLPPQIRSLAVLPLENLSGDAQQDYFADGITDQLITDLAQIRALRVISRTSVMTYKGERKALPQIARELNVDAVVEGTVLRSGERVRITAQLIQAPTDKNLWAETYEGNIRDTLVVQTKVAQAIAEQIRIKLTPQEQAGLRNLKEVEPDAYENYLKGRYFWNKRTPDGLRKAIQYFTQTITQDPNYAPAYSGLADSYALAGDWEYGVMTTKEALPKAITAAKKAIELDSNLSEAHTSLAFCLEGFNWDWQAADAEFLKAIELNPGYATGHHWYSWHLALLGKNEEAISEMRKAQNLDPLSLIINADLAELLLIARFPDESIAQSRKAIEMDSGFALAHNQLGQAYLAKSMFADAVSELQTAVRLSGRSAVSIANLARAYAASGRTDKAEELLNELKNRSSSGSAFSPELAGIYTALGDKTQAVAWIEKGYEDRFNPSVLLRPSFDPLRSDTRFKDLVRRIGLPR
jgi:TolB-like protein/DNA-binding winged helix-turn-helix (wHTH) protein/tetratricopeptide (TPR) repeat protein